MILVIIFIYEYSKKKKIVKWIFGCINSSNYYIINNYM